MRLLPWLGERDRGHRWSLPGLLAAGLAVILLGHDAPAASLVITPTFDSSITNSANAAVLERDINTAIGIYESLFSDPITVSILFRYSSTAPNGNPLPSGRLSQSNYVIYSRTYSTYITMLESDRANPGDPYRATALANLPPASAFPNAPTRIDVTSANGRAVGFTNTRGTMDSSGNVGSGTFDGIVTINSSQPFQFTRPVDSTHFDVMQSIEHEIDQVLGLSSNLPNTTDFTGNTAIRPEDLYRYSAPGTISFSAGASASYFSIDGGRTDIVPFNQNPAEDFGDWGATGGVPYVQLAFSFRGTQSDVSASSPEGIALDAIGYDLIPVPEPGALPKLAPLAVVLSIFAWGRRKRHAREVAA